LGVGNMNFGTICCRVEESREGEDRRKFDLLILEMLVSKCSSSTCDVMKKILLIYPREITSFSPLFQNTLPTLSLSTVNDCSSTVIDQRVPQFKLSHTTPPAIRGIQA
jgi:hypothetical protein